MLALLPADLKGSLGLETEYLHYVDLDEQLASVGVSVEVEPFENDRDASLSWQMAVRTLFIGNTWTGFDFASVASEEWRSIFGFSIVEIGAALSAGPSDNRVVLLTGRFERAAVEAAWTAAGYRWVDERGVQVARHGEDGAIDFADPIATMVFDAGAYDVVMLPNGVIVLASTIAALRSVLDVAIDGAPSFAGRQDIQTILQGLPSDPAAVTFFAGEMVHDDACGYAMATHPSVGPDDSAAISDELDRLYAEYGPMPPVTYVAMSRTAGGAIPDTEDGPNRQEANWPVAQTVVSLLFAGEADARDAAPVVLGRLEIGQSFVTLKPWTSTFPERSAQVLDGLPVVRLVLGTAEGSIVRGLDLFLTNDLAFLSYSTDADGC